MMEADIWKDKSSKAAVVHQPCMCRPYYGELIQIDGSVGRSSNSGMMMLLVSSGLQKESPVGHTRNSEKCCKSFATYNEKCYILQMKSKNLNEYIQDIQSKGEYTFSYAGALNALQYSDDALRMALHRLQAKKIIMRIHEKFYLIVPIEYRKAGTLPPTWFIDALMDNLNCEYYVGLLSAASLQGAAHQQPQQFQIVVNKILRPVEKRRIDIRFFYKNNLNNTQKSKLKTVTGYLWISKPEVTAIDLITYIKNVGYLGNVVTVLSELLEKLDPAELLARSKEKVPLAILQRLGYLLDLCEGEKISYLLHEWLVRQKIRRIPLRSDKSVKGAILNQKWKVLINDIIEIDE